PVRAHRRHRGNPAHALRPHGGRHRRRRARQPHELEGVPLRRAVCPRDGGTDRRRARGRRGRAQGEDLRPAASRARPRVRPRLAQRAAHGVPVEFRHLKERGLTEYTVVTRDNIAPGIFAKITGVLACLRFQIMEAEIVTRADGIVVDTFRGIDSDYAKEPPPLRVREFAEGIGQVLAGKQTVEAMFAARHDPAVPRTPQVPGPPTQVEIDNTTADKATIVEVFADDRLGLLYSIARTLFELDLSIRSAK